MHMEFSHEKQREEITKLINNPKQILIQKKLISVLSLVWIK